MPSDPEKLSIFFREQLSEWELPLKNFSDLNSCVTKYFIVEGSPVVVQFNPARITSTAAKVDTKSITGRKCFLCRENRPAQQKDYIFEDNYTILVNPFPIFPKHFTIPKNTHTPQAIQGEIAAMYKLTKVFGEAYSVFYNGPRCGASAPDHHHFQMGTAGFMPIENPASRVKPNIRSLTFPGYSAAFIHDNLRSYVEFRLQSEASESIYINAIEDFIEFYGEYLKEDTEPMLNIISFREKYSAEIVFFVLLRSKHRPSRYFSDGDDHMIISPASVDVGGKIITPRKEDFEKIDEQIIADIYKEVFIPGEQVTRIFEQYKKHLRL